MRGQANRNIGAGQPRDFSQARIVDRKAIGPCKQPQRGRGICRTAADAGRNRQHFVEREGACFQARHALAQQPRRLEHEIVGYVAAGFRQRAGSRKLQFRTRNETQAIGAVGKCNHTFQIVVAVNAASHHPKGQIDLGTSVFDKLARGDLAAASVVPPEVITNANPIKPGGKRSRKPRIKYSDSRARRGARP